MKLRLHLLILIFAQHVFPVSADDAHIATASQKGAHRIRNLRRFEPGDRDLIQERLKQVVIIPVDERDAHSGVFGEHAHGVQSGESRTDDNDVFLVLRTHPKPRPPQTVVRGA